MLVLIPLLAVLALGVNIVVAQTSEEINELQDEIAERRSSIDDINRRLEEYREKIREYSSKSASLLTDVALIENQAAMAELDIASTQNEIEAQNLEIALLEQGIREQTAAIEQQRVMLSGMLFSLHQHEERGIVAALFGADNFHEAFDSVVQLEEVNAGLERTVDATKISRSGLEANKAEHEVKLATLLDLERELGERVEKLGMQQQAKEVLLAQTSDSEAEYRTLMSELRQEQQYISSQVAALQNQMQDKLSETDEVGDVTMIAWPLHGIITALFHDTSYPFRHLFEHSGLDIATPVGTSVEAAAPGYVAWARTGRQYGNYVMIIHANGVATLYAHLMRIDVAPDQYVARGDQIGLSGGRPGMAGAGLSTGPHLHFEVRKDGIPVNPQDYLVD